MANFDKHIADFLSTNKRFSAQGLGEFVIVDGQAPNGAPVVEFTTIKGAQTSEELIAYVAELERKNKVVTSFDLEAHFNQLKQFINIGTPWMIPGYGQLQLGKSRELEFVQTVPSENILHERIKRKQAAAEAHTNTYEPTTLTDEQSSNTGTIVLTLLIVLALAAGGFYFYLNQNSADNTTDTENKATTTDTMVDVPPSSNMNNTVTTTLPPQPAGSAGNTGSSTATNGAGGVPSYKFILNRTTNEAYAKKRYQQLKTYGTKVFLDSSVKDNYSLYRIYLLQSALPSDTSRFKDSLTRYYGKPVTIER